MRPSNCEIAAKQGSKVRRMCEEALGTRNRCLSRPHRARAPLRPVHHGTELQHAKHPPAAPSKIHSGSSRSPARATAHGS